MTSRAFTLPLFASLLLHVAGLVFTARLTALSSDTPVPTLIPIEVVTVQSTPPAPLLRPKSKPPAVREITPSRPIEQPPSPPAIQSSAELPPLPQELPPSLPPPSPTQVEEPQPAPVIPLPATELTDPPGNVMGPVAVTGSQAVPSSAPAEGGEAGAGQLFAKSDMAVLPGAGAGGGSGGPGKSGLGLGTTDTGAKVPGLQLGLARPRGGYQIKPRYPESARRQGIEGTSLLRLLILIDGRVGEVLVERSAGHPDLDRAAVEAIKRWHFEPARRDHRAVVAWAVLPVEFKLKRW